MDKAFRAILLLVLVAGCRPAQPINPESRFSAIRPVPPLCDKVRAVVTVLTKDRRVAEHGLLALDFKLLNVSNADALVYNEIQSGWLVVVEVVGEDGRYARTPPLDAPKQNRAGQYHYACLPPGGFVGRTYTIQPADPRWNLTPGKYYVRALYHNPYEPCLASPNFSERDLEVFGPKSLVLMLTGTLASNVDEFVVVPD